MSQSQLLRTVIKVLEKEHVDYMLTGSVVSSMQGEPRSTHDIDMVVQITDKSIPALLKSFSSPDFYLSEESMKDAIRRRSTFNLLDVKNGQKIDFWLLTDDTFDRSRFSRKIDQQVFDVRLKVSAPEDTILMKLRWAEMSGGSEKQFTDALRVYELQYAVLNMVYLKHWIRELKLETLWSRLLEVARPLR